MTTLIAMLVGMVSIDNNRQIWAKKIDGKFEADSPTRIGYARYRHGGVESEYDLFAGCADIIQGMALHLRLDERSADSTTFAEEQDAARSLIDRINENERINK